MVLTKTNLVTREPSSVRLELEVLTLAASKVGDNQSFGGRPEFRMDAKLEETGRRTGEATFVFTLSISTEPALARFNVEGRVAVRGESGEIERMSAVNAATRVPVLISEIYSRTYSMIFILASGLRIPYPAAGLLVPSNTQPPGTMTDEQGSAIQQQERGIRT